MPLEPTTDTRVVKFPPGMTDTDRVAVEEPVEIRVEGEPVAVTMRTPGDDPELAAGFCLTEGVIDHPDELEHTETCTWADYGNVVLVTLAGAARARWQDQRVRDRRELFLSSSCGLCGVQTLDRIARRVEPVQSRFVLSATVLVRLPAVMAIRQSGFARSGGLHAAAHFTPDGQLRCLREDVGRHNAVDKLLGALLLSGQLPCGPGVLLVSGRASFELVQKAARAGVEFLAAVGAPSSLAVDAAERFGLTLVGFLRDDRFNAYTHPHRIVFG